MIHHWESVSKMWVVMLVVDSWEAWAKLSGPGHNPHRRLEDWKANPGRSCKLEQLPVVN